MILAFIPHAQMWAFLDCSDLVVVCLDERQPLFRFRCDALAAATAAGLWVSENGAVH